MEFYTRRSIGVSLSPYHVVATHVRASTSSLWRLRKAHGYKMESGGRSGYEGRGGGRPGYEGQGGRPGYEGGAH